MARAQVVAIGLVAAAASIALCAREARATGWTEAHEIAHDVRLRVDDAGHPPVGQAVTYGVVSGALKGFALPTNDREPVLEGEGDVPVGGEDGKTYAAHLSSREGEPGALRVDVLEPKGLK